MAGGGHRPRPLQGGETLSDQQTIDDLVTLIDFCNELFEGLDMEMNVKQAHDMAHTLLGGDAIYRSGWLLVQMTLDENKGRTDAWPDVRVRMLDLRARLLTHVTS